MNNEAKLTVKAHIAAGLDITAPVTWVNHLGQQVPNVTVNKEGRFWAVRTASGECLQNGGAGAKFVFVY